MMKREHRIRIAVAASLITLGVLVWLTIQTPPDRSNVVPGFVFGTLLLLTTTFGVLLVEGEVSLLPMTALAAYLVMGAVPAAWAALLATAAHGLVRLLWAEQLGLPQRPDPRELAGLTAANVSMHTAAILLGDLVYRSLGGITPLTTFNLSLVLPFVGLALTALAVNYSLAALYIAARSLDALRDYVRSIPALLLYEGVPMLFSPLMALIYTRLGQVMFALFALALGTVSLITRSLALASQRLGRRLRELDGLQAVGQALSASLEVDGVLEAIHDQVTRLMQARNFYVALYDAEADEVSFPWRPRGGAGAVALAQGRQRPDRVRPADQDVAPDQEGCGGGRETPGCGAARHAISLLVGGADAGRRQCAGCHLHPVAFEAGCLRCLAPGSATRPLPPRPRLPSRTPVSTRAPIRLWPAGSRNWARS